MQNIVTKCPQRGLETRIYLVLRNNFVFGRKRKKSNRQNVCKKIEVWISLKQCIRFHPILKIWIQVVRLVFKNHALGGRGPLEFVMICCHFISISGEEEFECRNCQQPSKQSAIPTQVLPLGKGTKIPWFLHYYLPAENSYCTSEAGGGGEGNRSWRFQSPKQVVGLVSVLV